MGKKIAVVLMLSTVFLIFGYFYKNNDSVKKKNITVSSQISSTTVSPVLTSKKTTSIFVPYWTDFKVPLKLNDYDRIIYFGISPTLQGFNEEEAGYEKLQNFVSSVGDKKKLLTIRMTNTEINMNILQNKVSWKKIIKESLDIVEKYKFDGIVLDLEISSLPFTDMVQDINGFVQDFYTQSIGRNLYFAITLYGDTFYRKRPYDVEFLSKHSDEIMIMAYDLHKAGGEPGPNFSLGGRDKYGYDYQTLIDDFSLVPAGKTSVIFGMYGYDWIVDEKKRPIKPATSLSLNEIQKKFLNNCQWKNCVILRDQQSAETEVDYVDEYEQYHVVWFEDLKSVEQKQKLLQEKGIDNFIYWAYGYF